MIQIDPRDPTPIYRQVMDQIKLQITAGRLAPGEQLESVANLAGRLRVNPMTISKAYGFLVEEGVVERRRGVGIFVAVRRTQDLEKERHDLLAGAMDEAAGLSVQLGVARDDALNIFGRHYDRFQQKKGKKS